MHHRLRRFLHRRFRSMETRVHELNYLFWECTVRCNLHCLHCGSDCTADCGQADMPAGDFLKAFDTIPAVKRAERFTVVITGGEPLVRNDLPEIGRALRQRGVGWSIVTNGWLYDQAMHRRLMAAGLGALTISLDGLEDDHDWLRGRMGSHNRAINAIAIAAHEPRLNFDVVTCVNQRNLPHLLEIHNLLETIGVKQWRLFTIIPIGRALQHDELQLTPTRFRMLMDFIASKRSGHKATVIPPNGRKEIKTPAPEPRAMNVTFSCEGYLGNYECRVRQVPHFCHAGVNIASVLIDGTICACPNIDRHRFAQGNIYHDNLWQVWQTRFGEFRDRRWARQGICKDCKMFGDCLGGGMHNFHGNDDSPINCLYHKTLLNQ